MANNKKLRVLQLGSPAGLYGAERWILALVKHLDTTRVESIVSVILDGNEQDGPLCQEAQKLGFRTHYFKGQGKINLSVINQIQRFIVQENIAILHTHFYKTDIIGYLATRGTNCKIVSTPHGWSKNVDFKLWCYEKIDRLLFPLFDAVVPLSEELNDSLARIPGLKKKLHFIRNGVDLAEIYESKTIHPNLLAQKQGGKYIIGYIGRLIPGKGLVTLIKALAQTDSIPWQLYLIGEGPMKQELEELAQDFGIIERVHFLGFRPDRLDFLRGFDVAVLPSKQEGIPRCLMEAMGAMVPVIASNIPGCRVLVQDKRTGYLFDVGNHQMLREVIESVCFSEQERKNIAQNGEKMIHEHYSFVRVAAEYEKLYYKLA